MKEKPKFFNLFSKHVASLKNVKSDVVKRFGIDFHIDFKVSHDTTDSIMTVSRRRCVNLRDELETDIFLNCVACEITKYELRNLCDLVMSVVPRTRTLSINLIVH